VEVWIHPSSKGKEVMRSAQRWQLVTAKGKVYGSCEIGVLVLAVSRGQRARNASTFDLNWLPSDSGYWPSNETEDSSPLYRHRDFQDSF